VTFGLAEKKESATKRTKRLSTVKTRTPTYPWVLTAGRSSPNGGTGAGGKKVRGTRMTAVKKVFREKEVDEYRGLTLGGATGHPHGGNVCKQSSRLSLLKREKVDRGSKNGLRGPPNVGRGGLHRGIRRVRTSFDKLSKYGRIGKKNILNPRKKGGEEGGAFVKLDWHVHRRRTRLGE